MKSKLRNTIEIIAGTLFFLLMCALVILIAYHSQFPY